MIHVVSDKLLEAMNYVKDCIGKDTSRPLMMGIHMKKVKNELIVEACDAFRTARMSIHIQQDTDEDGKFDIVVSPFKLEKTGFMSVLVSLEVQGELLVVTDLKTKEFHAHRLTTGEYQNLDTIIPSTPPILTLAVNPKFLLQAMKQCLKNPFKSAIMEFYGEIQPIVIRQFRTTDTAYTLVLPKRL